MDAEEDILATSTNNGGDTSREGGTEDDASRPVTSQVAAPNDASPPPFDYLQFLPPVETVKEFQTKEDLYADLRKRIATELRKVCNADPPPKEDPKADKDKKDDKKKKKKKKKLPFELPSGFRAKSNNDVNLGTPDLTRISYLLTGFGDKQCINDADDDGTTALMLAAWRNRAELIEYLVKRGASVELKDKFGKTAMHKAAARGNVEAITELQKAGASIICTDNYGNTPLHAAVRNGHKPAITLLLSFGADPTLKNSRGVLPVDAVGTPSKERPDIAQVRSTVEQGIKRFAQVIKQKQREAAGGGEAAAPPKPKPAAPSSNASAAVSRNASRPATVAKPPASAGRRPSTGSEDPAAKAARLQAEEERKQQEAKAKEEEAARAKEEAQKKKDEEAKKKEDEKRKKEDDAKRKEEEKAQRKEDEAKQKEEDKARAAEDKKKKADDEKQKKEDEKQKKEDEKKRKEEEAQRKKAEEAAKKEEAARLKKLAEEKAARLKFGNVTNKSTRTFCSATLDPIDSGKFGPESTVDGQEGTMWVGAPPDCAWIVWDLGVVREINRLRVRFERVHPTVYELLGSAVDEETEPSDWTSICERSDGHEGWNDVEISPVQHFRYVKLHEKVSAVGGTGMTIWQVEIIGRGPLQPGDLEEPEQPAAAPS